MEGGFYNNVKNFATNAVVSYEQICFMKDLNALIKKERGLPSPLKVKNVIFIISILLIANSLSLVGFLAQSCSTKQFI